MSDVQVTQSDVNSAWAFDDLLPIAALGIPDIERLAEHFAAHAARAVEAYKQKLANDLRRFDALPAVNRAMQWPEPPPCDERWERAVCSAAERVRLQIIQKIENT